MRSADSAHQHLPSLQSWALSSTFSPTFCTSLPAPAMVLQPDSTAIENMAIISRVIARFMCLLLGGLGAAAGASHVAAACADTFEVATYRARETAPAPFSPSFPS